MIDTEFGVLKRHGNQMQTRIGAATIEHPNIAWAPDVRNDIDPGKNEHDSSERRYPNRIRKQTDFYGTRVP